VFGIGLNSFEENMSAYDSSGITNIIQQPVHNLYCLVAAETGIPSAVLFVVIGGVMLARAWRLLRDRREIAFVTGAIGVTTFLSTLVFNLFDIGARKEPVLGMLVLVAAMVMSFERDGTASRVSTP
jgi:O-antigen ligase